MKKFAMTIPGRLKPVHFTEEEVRTYEDFADPEREDTLKLNKGESVKFSDGAEVTRTE